jgi:hypothetical protein
MVYEQLRAWMEGELNFTFGPNGTKPAKTETMASSPG